VRFAARGRGVGGAGRGAPHGSVAATAVRSGAIPCGTKPAA